MSRQPYAAVWELAAGHAPLETLIPTAAGELADMLAAAGLAPDGEVTWCTATSGRLSATVAVRPAAGWCVDPADMCDLDDPPWHREREP